MHYPIAHWKLCWRSGGMLRQQRILIERPAGSLGGPFVRGRWSVCNRRARAGRSEVFLSASRGVSVIPDSPALDRVHRAGKALKGYMAIGGP